MFLPSEKQCYWCGGRMKTYGTSSLGSGINYVNYRCEDCKGIAHYVRCDERPIDTFDVTYHLEKEKKDD